MNDSKKYQLLLEYQNGFGIQYPTPTNCNVPICIINEKFDSNGDFIKVDYEDLTNEIKKEVEAITLDWNRYCGKAFLKIDFSKDYDKIESILTILIKKGFNIQITNKMLTSFGPKQMDTEFKFEYIEKRIIEEMKKFMKDSNLFHIIIGKNDNRLDIWNWKTIEGQLLCKEMRRFKCLPIECDPKDNFYIWDPYLHFDEWQKEHVVSWTCF